MRSPRPCSDRRTLLSLEEIRVSEEPERGVTLQHRQLKAILDELQAALDALEELAPLCSIQTRASRAEEAIGAAMYLLHLAQRNDAAEP
jgi:hypothetical protein